MKKMRAYVWQDGVGLEYIVFAFCVKEAKAFLYERYEGKDLDRLLFNKRVRIRKMPRGLCSMSPAHTVWFT